MNGHEFPKDVVIADTQARRPTLEFQILRRIPNHTARMKNIVCSDRRRAGQMDVWPNLATRTNNHLLINDRVRPYTDRGIKLCLGMYDGRRVNHAGAGERLKAEG